MKEHNYCPIDRRTFLTQSGLIVAGCTVRPTSPLFSQPAKNIVFILADDLGCAELKAYNPSSPILTPNIDTLALSGTTHANAYAPAPVCLATRSCIHTGRFMNEQDRLFSPFLTPDDITIAHKLQAAGYATGLFGKSQLGWANVGLLPNAAGYDEFFGSLTLHGQKYPAKLWHNQDEIVLSGEYGPDLYLSQALQFIDDNAGRPFFLNFSSNLPHWENATQDYDVPIDFYPGASWPQVEKNFANSITYLDQQIGAIVSKLAGLNLLSNTLIVLASDNGPDPARAAYWGTLGRRGAKMDIYEGGIRVPLITNQVSTFSNDLITLVDLHNIFLAAAGFVVPTRQRDYVYFGWEAKSPFPVAPGVVEAVRQGDYKLVRNRGAIELYNLAIDIGETNNLAGVRPRKVAELLRMMDADCPEPKQCRLWLPVVK